MELVNLKKIREARMNLPELTKEDKKTLWLVFKKTRESNRQKIVDQILGNDFIDSQMLESGALVCNGWGKVNEVCCVIANINDCEFRLYEDFNMKIGSHQIAIDFKGANIFTIDMEDVVSFKIRWGC